MKHLYFMRHGLSVMNQQGLFSGRNDTPLAEEGIKQCEDAAKIIKGLGIDAIVASPMERTIESAKIIAKDIGYPLDKIIVSELFVERSFGPLEGTTYRPRYDLDDTKGVEHSKDIIKRAKAGLRMLKGLDADCILVVSHGALGRALRIAIDPTVDFHKTERFNNAEVVKLI